MGGKDSRASVNGMLRGCEPERLPSAQDDIFNHAEYLSDVAGDRSAMEFMDSIIAACERLAEFPMLGRQRPTCGREMRRIVVGNHVLYYRVHTDDVVEVLRVRHHAQDNDEIFGIRT